MAVKTVGKNVKFEVTKDNELVIRVDLKARHGKSKSGKTTVIGTTEGNKKALDSKENEFSFGVNVYTWEDD